MKKFNYEQEVRSPNRYKPIDQPNSSFYQNTFQREKNRQVISPFKFEKNSYVNTELEIISASSREKKFLDGQSNIFYESDYQSPGRIHQKNSEKIHNYSSIQWNNPHLETIATYVNEMANFDSNYARERKLLEFRTNILPAFSNDLQNIQQSVIKANSNSQNEDIKRQNQNFSDLFNQECGFKGKAPQQKERQISPQVHWTDHDSIRHAKDCSQVQINNHHKRLKTDDEQMSETFFNCFKQSAALKGYSSIYNMQKALKQQSTNKQPLKDAKYEGLYKWKQNYKKK